MASRSLGPDPASNPRNIGLDMRQGGDVEGKLPRGLQATMRQGSTPSASLPSGIGSTMHQGPGKKSGKK